MHYIRVGVIMGGRSIEREVSLNSGRTVCDHLDTSRYSVVPIFQKKCGTLYILPWVFLHRGKISDFEHRLEREAEKITWDALRQRIDLMYIALHGRYGEDGTMQGMLEILRIPYCGSKVFASALGMNKAVQKTVLRAAGIRVPHDYTVASAQFPLIVKPVQEGSSFGVSKVLSVDELSAAVAHAAHARSDKSSEVIIEEYIEGMEFSCIVITDPVTSELIALPPTEIELEPGSPIFDYEQKYMPGRAVKHTPARCSSQLLEKIQHVCVQAFRALEFATIGRIDGFLTRDGDVVITDPNSFSGMAPSSYAFVQAAQIGMSHTAFINHLIATELHAYGMLNEGMHYKEREATMQRQQKIRIAVMLGGVSNEKEISLESGRNVVYKLSPHKYDVTPLFLNKELQLYAIPHHVLVLNSTAEIEERLTSVLHILWSDLPAMFDFVFIALHGGVGENGAVQGALETLNIPYNGSGVLASALCMDKYKTNQFLRTQGFEVPQHWLVARAGQDAHHERGDYALVFPLIVKPHDDGCSVMVQKVHNKEELQSACAQLFANGKEYAMVEEFVQGMELTVGVIGNDEPRALPPSQAVAAAGILSIEEKFLPGAGENQTPAPLPGATLRFVQTTMEAVYRAVGCKGYVRIDCFYQTADQSATGKERVVVLEINSLPGMTPATCLFHQAAEIGIRPMDFIDMIVQLGFEYHCKLPHLSPDQQKIFAPC